MVLHPSVTVDGLFYWSKCVKILICQAITVGAPNPGSEEEVELC